MRNAIFAVLTALACTTPAAAERFDVRYFYDQDESSVSFTDIAFPSAKRGLATGVLSTNGRDRGVVLLTNDAGATWTTVSLNDIPVSLYCLDEAACWLVAEKGIWFSEEGGREWKRVLSERGLLRVWFVTRERGFAVGAQKKLIETRDGGKSWKKMPVTEELKERSDRLTFSAIAFLTPKVGMIIGRSEPESTGEVPPIWLSTTPEFRRERPTLSVAMETRDGGETWKIAESSMFGRVGRMRPRGTRALVLVEFDRYFEVPSELYLADFLKGGNQSVLRRKDFAMTDVALLSTGIAFATGYEPPGKLAQTPVPGKVRVMRAASDLKIWTDIPVDYRAVARRVSIAVSPENAVWIATDQGMILQLIP